MGSRQSRSRPWVSRESVACACGFNWLALVLLIFATASGYWSWGYSSPNSLSPTAATASTGAWFAGSLWSLYPVPCNCANGFCYSWCYIGSEPVRWGGIPASAACAPDSVVYKKWSGPLGYCSFPDGAPPESPPEGSPPANSTGEDTFGGAPPGTVFKNPSQPGAIQGLTITSCILVFLAAIAGCVDAGNDPGIPVAGIVAAFLSFIAFVLTLAAYSVWSTFPYVQGLQGASPSSVWMPVWVNTNQNQMTAVQVSGFTWGPGWATAITASILVFFTFLFHCLSTFGRSGGRKFAAPYGENVSPNAPPTSAPYEAKV